MTQSLDSVSAGLVLQDRDVTSNVKKACSAWTVNKSLNAKTVEWLISNLAGADVLRVGEAPRALFLAGLNTEEKNANNALEKTRPNVIP